MGTVQEKQGSGTPIGSSKGVVTGYGIYSGIFLVGNRNFFLSVHVYFLRKRKGSFVLSTGIQLRVKKLLYDCYYINNEGHAWVRALRLQCLIGVQLQQLQCNSHNKTFRHLAQKRKKKYCVFFFFFFFLYLTHSSCFAAFLLFVFRA